MSRRGTAIGPAGPLGLLGLVLVLLALTGCGREATRAAVEPPSIAPSVPPAAVPTPAPATPSLLVNQARPFTESEVRRVRRLDGVTHLALIGYGPVWVYGEQIPTAAVDPATYRSFTPPDTRGAIAAWKAVTDGNALVSHTVGERDHLPLDATVPAGWGTVRIAGLATTVPGVDMVVGSATGERIGVPFGNGLVVAVSGDSASAAARVRAALGPTPVIRRIVSAGDLGVPSGPLHATAAPPVRPPAGAPAIPAPVPVATPGAPATRPAPVPAVPVPAPDPAAPARLR